MEQVIPRIPKLRKRKISKTTYWYTEAGGRTYFGNVEGVPSSEARKLFSEHVKSLTEGSKSRNGLSVAELVEKFLEWIDKRRSPRSYQQKREHLNMFGNFKVGGKMIYDLPADKGKGDVLEAFLTHRRKKCKNVENTRSHDQTSIKHCWNWATKHPSPTPYLSPMVI